MDKQVFAVLKFAPVTKFTTDALQERIDDLAVKKDTPIDLHSTFAYDDAVYVTVGWFEWAERPPVPDDDTSTVKRQRRKARA